jgi:hypothetical protein
VGPVIVQPGGRWTNGQPLDISSGGDTARDAVTLYGHDGQVLSHTGNTSNLNRITRPINHGNPFAYKSLFHRPVSATRAAPLGLVVKLCLSADVGRAPLLGVAVSLRND